MLHDNNSDIYPLLGAVFTSSFIMCLPVPCCYIYLCLAVVFTHDMLWYLPVLYCLCTGTPELAQLSASIQHLFQTLACV